MISQFGLPNNWEPDLTIAGEIREVDKPFLEKEVMKYIDGERIKFVGEIGHEEKVRVAFQCFRFAFSIPLERGIWLGDD